MQISVQIGTSTSYVCSQPYFDRNKETIVLQMTQSELQLAIAHYNRMCSLTSTGIHCNISFAAVKNHTLFQDYMQQVLHELCHCTFSI